MKAGSLGGWGRWSITAVGLVAVVGALGGGFFVLRPLLLASPTSMDLLPGSVTLCTGQSQQFSAVADSAALGRCTWSATGGQVGTEGFYVAPGSAGDLQVCARCGAATACAAVRVQVCETALPTPTASVTVGQAIETFATFTPVSPPTHTPTPTPTPSATPTPTPLPVASDAPLDFVYYTTGAEAPAVQGGADLALVSLGPDGHIVLNLLPSDAPDQLRDWLAVGRVVLWMKLHDPIPAELAPGRYWLFALDTDGNPATGRPVGSAPVNPDIGPEIIMGLQRETGNVLKPYSMVWDAAAGTMAVRNLGVEFALDADRDTVFLAVDWNVLSQEVSRSAGVVADVQNTRGRSATLTGSGAEQVVDFAPDLP